MSLEDEIQKMGKKIAELIFKYHDRYGVGIEIAFKECEKHFNKIEAERKI